MTLETIFNLCWMKTFADNDEDMFSKLFEESDEEEEEEESGVEEDETVLPDGADDGDEALNEEPDLEDEPVAEQLDGSEEETKPVVEPVAKPVKAKPVEPEEEEAPAVEQKPFDVEAYKGELQKLYALSDDDADAVLTDPGTVLPKLMANAHLTMMQQMGQMMQAQLQRMPELISQTMNSKSAETTRLDAFTKAYPTLVTDEAAPYVVNAIKTIKAANPKISFEDLIKKVGPVVGALMGTTVVPVGAKPPVKPAAVGKPKPFVAPRSTSAPQKVVKQTAEQEFYSKLLED